ncbi:MAG: PD40 domain-containing protein [Thermoflexales bacterium]|nr:PD40 domain-containing protein [Thermoflexales bacterium]
MVENTTRLCFISIVSLLLVSACLSSPAGIPKLDLPGVSLLEEPSRGHISEAAWSADSQSLLVINWDEGRDHGPYGSVYLLDVKDNKTTPLLESTKLFNVRNPHLSADGVTALFHVETSPFGYGIHALNLQTSEVNVIFDSSLAAWSKSEDAVALLDASECPTTESSRRVICVVDTVTGQQKIIYSSNQRVPYGGMDWSPDNSRLVISLDESYSNPTDPYRHRLYLYDLHSGDLSPLTSAQIDATDPAWSPDGKYIAYSQFENKSIGDQLMVIRADGSCKVPLIPAAGFVNSPVWSPDGNWLSVVFDFRLYKVDLNNEAIKRTLASCS